MVFSGYLRSLRKPKDMGSNLAMFLFYFLFPNVSAESTVCKKKQIAMKIDERRERVEPNERCEPEAYPPDWEG